MGTPLRTARPKTPTITTLLKTHPVLTASHRHTRADRVRVTVVRKRIVMRMEMSSKRERKVMKMLLKVEMMMINGKI